MTMTLLLCLLFFFGYLALGRHGQALAFLAIGAGFQVMTYLVPAPDGETVSFDTFVLVCLSSVAGYIAWRMGRRHMEGGLLARHRIGIFVGVAANVLIAAFILWQTGVITLNG